MTLNFFFIFLKTILLFFPLFSFAQNANEVERSWTSFAQKMNIESFRGCYFEIESKIKTELTSDSTGKAQMWVRVDTKRGAGFFDNMSERPVVKNKWESYKISGKIDTNAISLVFGGLCQNNGTFYFDDFTIKIKKDSKWLKIDVPNANFESISMEPWVTGIGKNKTSVKGFELTIFKKNNTENKVMKVTGQGIPIFGDDKSKGNYFSTNGVKLYYETYGIGEPILLLHGNGQSIKAFEKQIPFFEKKYQLIIPDCRGRGKSTDSDEELTYDIQASDMNNLLNHLKLDSVNVIGWSDGGIIGLILAMDYPKKVKKLIASGANVLQDTSAYFGKDLENFKKWQTDTNYKPIYRKLFKLLVKYPNIHFESLSKIKCPTLIIAGDKDEIKIGHTIKIFESIPNAQLFIVPKTSHYVLNENSKVFNEAALKFLLE